MNLIYLYFGIALAIATGIYFYLSSISAKKKPRVDALYTEALNAMVNGDVNSAISILRQVVKQDSNHVRAYLQLGNILRDENPEQAINPPDSIDVILLIPVYLKLVCEPL